MPRPPDFDGWHDIKFITNFFLAGCVPPFDAFVEFSQEPSQDLLMLFLVPDLTDIGQAIFQPGGGRRRKPARHGRKRRRGIGLPDPSDLIGNRVRAVVNPYDVVRWKPLVRVFRIWNYYELLNISVAVIEGLSNVGFETLWGVFKHDPKFCNNLDRLGRHRDNFEDVISPNPGFDSINLLDIDFSKGFRSSQFSCRHDTKPFVINLRCNITGGHSFDNSKGTLVLRNDTTGEMVESGPYDLKPGETTSRSITAEFPANTWVSWGINIIERNVGVTKKGCLAYTKADLPFGF